MTFRESGKKKAITLSFDDGVLQDIKTIELLDKYGLKATFNLNSELLGRPNILRFEDSKSHIVPRYVIAPEHVKEVYANHEVAAHTLTHTNLITLEDDNEIIRQVEQDRLNLSQIVGYEVVGMAYAGGGANNNDHCAELIRNHTGIQYARSLRRSLDFEMPKNIFRLAPSATTDFLDQLDDLVDQFIELETDKPKLLFIMGHTYSLDYEIERWLKLESIFEKLSYLDDVFYGTNKEVLL